MSHGCVNTWYEDANGYSGGHFCEFGSAQNINLANVYFREVLGSNWSEQKQHISIA
jgi:hypothetical protein